MDQVNQIEPKDENEKKLTWQQRLVTDLRDVVVVLVAFLLLFMMAFRIVSVKGPSMYDTLLDGDRLILLSSGFYREPKQGEHWHKGQVLFSLPHWHFQVCRP